MKKFDNVTEAFKKSLIHILDNGKEISVRENNTKEIAPYAFSIINPLKRTYVIPNRKNNIFSTIAETLWVIGGRNDIDYLSYYLPRAKDFSDDGLVWRAGYGLRLRHWKGVDQFKEVVRLLKKDKNTRRAVMSIFDPEQDYIDSVDIPCNNWLHFLVRDNKLNMNIAIRSCDIMWGFTGINTFEWSVIQEIIAFWSGYEVGSMSFFVGSFHLYGRHYKRAQELVDDKRNKILYDFGISNPQFATPLESFDETIKYCFQLETKIRQNKNAIPEILLINDEFLKNSLIMLQIHHLWKTSKNGKEISEAIKLLSSSDFKVAAIEFFKRRNCQLELTLSENEKLFFEYYNSNETKTIETENIVNSIRKLHYKKTLIYRDSWRKRGEILSILSNISRKYDRIENVVEYNLKPTADESLVDTIVDLAVYATKYMTFIAEKYPKDFCLYFKNKNIKDISIYTKNEGFDYVLILLIETATNNNIISKLNGFDICFQVIKNSYITLEKELLKTEKQKNNLLKCDACLNMSIASLQYIKLLFQSEPTSFVNFTEFVKSL